MIHTFTVKPRDVHMHMREGAHATLHHTEYDVVRNDGRVVRSMRFQSDAQTKADRLNAAQRPTDMRGLICVERMVADRLEWLPIVNQSAYREWVGCFSLLGAMPC